MTETTALDAAHRANRRNAWIARGILALGVAALVLNTVARSRRDGGGDVGTILVIAAVMVAIVAVVMMTMGSNTRKRNSAVRALRRESEIIEVWGAAGLRDALAAEGIPEAPVRARQGTALTMTFTAAGLELWAGTSSPQKIHALAWSDVARVAEGAGVVANDGAKPAVVVVTRAGNGLVLLPARNPAGSIRTAALPQVRALVGRLETLRAGAAA